MGEAYDHQKRLIRRRIESARSRLSPTDAARLSAAIGARVLGLSRFAAAQHVVVYAAVDNEVDPFMIAECATEAGKALYYPLPPGKAPGFARASSPVGRGAEVPSGGVPLTAPGDDTLFLVPGVAFDPRGVRLGRGRGWYDRALTAHPGASRVGLAYEFQVVPVLPEAPWDIRLDAIVTESRLIDVPRGVQ